jgi:hypothetical protein
MIKNLFNLPVRDTQTGLKVFRRRVLDDVLPRLLVKKFAYDVELLAAAVRFGYKVSEVPVVLEFKRDLKWGRIRIEDVMSLFIDTLAVFYRLKIMRYYDSERPPLSQEKKSLLVIFHGCSPTEEVKDRLIADSVRIACMHEGATDGEIDGVLAFRGIDDLVSWLRNTPHSFDFVGFIGDGCIPVGSWAKYAVSNFDDPLVQAVCGPVIPGLCKSRREKAAGLVFSAGIVRGSDAYLYSFRPVRNVHGALMENVFVRASLLTLENPDNTDFIMSGGYMCARRFHKGILRYDPDVAVLKKVHSLFMPYIRTVAEEEFLKGFSAIRHKHECMSLRPLVFTAILVVLAGGLAVLPRNVNMIIWSVYGAAVVGTALTCFNLISAPLFAIGIVCDHLVRACAFPAGVIKGVFSGMMRHKNLKS